VIDNWLDVFDLDMIESKFRFAEVDFKEYSLLYHQSEESPHPFSVYIYCINYLQPLVP